MPIERRARIASPEALTAHLATVRLRLQVKALVLANDPVAVEQAAYAQEERRKCRESFRYFLRYWHFRNRETGEVLTFEHLWPGQDEFAALMETERWILALKGGKLGFTQLETAWDAWVAIFGPPGCRVHIFSRTFEAAKELLEYVKFGIESLPEWMRPSWLTGEPGGETAHSLKFRMAPYDVRTIIAYSAGANVSVDQTCNHAHVDELARMAFPKQTWSAVETTIAPGGTCHIVSRGKGPANYLAALWKAARAEAGRLKAFFAPWTARPDRDAGWYAEQSGDLTQQELRHFAPETPEDSLAGDENEAFVPMQSWDNCFDPGLPALRFKPAPAEGERPVLLPIDRELMVIAIDAATSNDSFAAVACTRHPVYPEVAAIRLCEVWEPRDGEIDFAGPEMWLRMMCANFNVVEIAYDPYQLHDMMQRFVREGVANCKPFDQQSKRLKSDRDLRTLILNRGLLHNGDKRLRAHIEAAGVKLYREEKALRIVKLDQDNKVDLAVAASMAVYEALYLTLV